MNRGRFSIVLGALLAVSALILMIGRGIADPVAAPEYLVSDDGSQLAGGTPSISAQAPNPWRTPVATPTPQPSPTPTPGPSPTVASPSLRPPVPQPGRLNQVMPLFQKPFDGDFPLFNIFDHDLPFHSRDTNGYMLTWWGGKTTGHDGHDGWDWLMPEGTPILAAADGIVTRAAVAAPFWCAPLERMVGDSLGVEIRHLAPNGDLYLSAYYHISRADVKKGDRVVAGQQIALSGNSGCSLVPHLHFGVFLTPPGKTTEPTDVDPYGWEADWHDPWAQQSEGSQSVWLWKDGQAPVIYREARQPLDTRPDDESPAAITVVRWMGWKDSDHLNNEFVQIELDPRSAPSGRFDLSGARLVNNGGSAFVFPRGTVVRSGTPLRVFTGPGTNSESVLFWGRGAGAWDDLGDCARLVQSNGQVLGSLPYGDASCPQD